MGLRRKRDEEDFNEYPEEMKADYLFLCSWINELVQTYREKIRIEIINVSSFRGLYKSIRHWIQAYPAFIVNRKEKYIGRDKSQLDLILQNHLGPQ